MKLLEGLKKVGLFLLANILGLVAYLALEHWWLRPVWSDADFKGDPVRGWLGTSMPLFAFYFGVNVTWLLMSKKNGSLGIGRVSLWILVVAVWMIVLAREPINLRGFLEMLNRTAWP
jgi:hypothetical protein